MDGFPGARQNVSLAINNKKKKKLTVWDGILLLAKSSGLNQLCSPKGKGGLFRHKVPRGRGYLENGAPFSMAQRVTGRMSELGA